MSRNCGPSAHSEINEGLTSLEMYALFSYDIVMYPSLDTIKQQAYF